MGQGILIQSIEKLFFKSKCFKMFQPEKNPENPVFILDPLL